MNGPGRPGHTCFVFSGPPHILPHPAVPAYPISIYSSTIHTGFSLLHTCVAPINHTGLSYLHLFINHTHCFIRFAAQHTLCSPGVHPWNKIPIDTIVTFHTSKLFFKILRTLTVIQTAQTNDDHHVIF